MSLGFQEIVHNEKDLLTDHNIWGGAGGALLGLFLARAYNAGGPASAALVLSGHFAGHSAAKML